jgi:hypothetical protein
MTLGLFNRFVVCSVKNIFMKPIRLRKSTYLGLLLARALISLGCLAAILLSGCVTDQTAQVAVLTPERVNTLPLAQM